MTGVQLQPVDSWFFRDGTPFSADSAPQEDVGSLFPPHPPTLVGALRAALARSGGWNGREPWSGELCAVLGNGPGDLGSLSFAGPFLLRDGQPLFRAPRHLFGRNALGSWEPCALLRPGATVLCDLGDSVWLPEFPTGEAEGLKTGDAVWLTATGMNTVLAGRPPEKEEVVPDNALWSDELRVGLERDHRTHTAKESRLYSTRHVRLRSGVALGMRFGGVPPAWPLPFGHMLPLGGESRMADCQEWNSGLGLDAPIDRIKDTRTVTLIALSPLDFDGPVRAGTGVTGLDGACVVSACLDRPQRIGGWDSVARRPLPMRSVLAPGSVLFCYLAEQSHFADTVAAQGGVARIGSRQEWGFGVVGVGAWPADGG